MRALPIETVLLDVQGFAGWDVIDDRIKRDLTGGPHVASNCWSDVHELNKRCLGISVDIHRKQIRSSCGARDIKLVAVSGNVTSRWCGKVDRSRRTRRNENSNPAGRRQAAVGGRSSVGDVVAGNLEIAARH